MRARGTQTVVATARQNGVLGNDSDPDGDTLTVTGISAAVAGNVGTPLVGQFGTLTLADDGTYTYTADHAAGFEISDFDAGFAIVNQSISPPRRNPDLTLGRE